MAELHEIIDKLCKQRGISGAKMCGELGISRSTLTELRKGRAKTLNIDTALKIAEYFDVSVDYLLGRHSSVELQKQENTGAPQLKSIAMIEGNQITREEDLAISAFIDYLITERKKE